MPSWVSLRPRAALVNALLPLLALSCSRDRPKNQGASPPAASSAPAPVAPASGAPAASAAPPARPAEEAPCAFARGLRGTVGPARVFMRLTRSGASLRGEYTYEQIGTPLALVGTISGDAISLAEGEPTKSTGQFEGKCGPDGKLQGTWTKPAGSPLAFSLEPVGPRDEVEILKRKKQRKFSPKPSTEPPPGMGFQFEKNEACVDEAVWPEIFGAATPEIERAINAKLRLDKPLFDKGEADALKACRVGERVSGVRSFEVKQNSAGLLAVAFSEGRRYEGGTHPWDPGDESWLMFDTKTGAEIRREHLIASTPQGREALNKLLNTCATAWAKKGSDDDDEMIISKFTLGNDSLLVAPTADGLQFGAVGYPPPARVLEGKGFTLRWPALLASKALPAASPVARLWAGKAPSAADPCLFEK